MKKLLLLLTTLFIVLTLSACSDICIGAGCINDDSSSTGATTDFMIPFVHINGEAAETDKFAYLLFEEPVQEYVKYQITYLSCTCRSQLLNYWQVAFVEINKYTNDIRTLSFGQDGVDGHYTAGMWGDSDPTPSGRTLVHFETEFIPWLVGQSLTTLEGISVFTNESYHGMVENTANIDEQVMIDDFAGSSVSTNNMIRVIKALLEYHEDAYN